MLLVNKKEKDFCCKIVIVIFTEGSGAMLIGQIFNQVVIIFLLMLLEEQLLESSDFSIHNQLMI